MKFIDKKGNEVLKVSNIHKKTQILNVLLTGDVIKDTTLNKEYKLDGFKRTEFTDGSLIVHVEQYYENGY